MEQLKDFLRHVVPENPSSLKPSECGEWVNESPVATCSACSDLRFIVLDKPLGDPLYGKALPCRACNMSFRQTFANFEDIPGTEKALKASKRLVSGELTWLLLMGPPGAGKSHLLHAIEAEIRYDYGQVLYKGVPDLMEEIKAGFDDHTSEARVLNAMSVETLLLDDLGAGRDVATPWVKEQVYRIVNRRYERQLPTAITTNLDFDGIVRAHDGRLASRLFDRHVGEQVEMTAKDYRTGKEW